jgi:hypothetical protein
MHDSSKQRLIVGWYYILSMLVMIVIMWQFLPEGRFHEGTTVHTVFRVFWWVCGAVSLYIGWRMNTLKDSIIGTIFSVIFAPIVLLTLGLLWCHHKVKGFSNESTV